MRIKYQALFVALGAVAAGTASAAGCLTGAAVGGVAGHVAGHHALIGAAAGCAINHHRMTVRNRAAASRGGVPAQSAAPVAPPPTATDVKAR